MGRSRRSTIGGKTRFDVDEKVVRSGPAAEESGEQRFRTRTDAAILRRDAAQGLFDMAAAADPRRLAASLTRHALAHMFATQTLPAEAGSHES
jgi:hypothetical protein